MDSRESISVSRGRSIACTTTEEEKSNQDIGVEHDNVGLW